MSGTIAKASAGTFFTLQASAAFNSLKNAASSRTSPSLQRSPFIYFCVKLGQGAWCPPVVPNKRVCKAARAILRTKDIGCCIMLPFSWIIRSVTGGHEGIKMVKTLQRLQARRSADTGGEQDYCGFFKDCPGDIGGSSGVRERSVSKENRATAHFGQATVHAVPVATERSGKAHGFLCFRHLSSLVTAQS
eukprot:1390467-Pleurochrysis_carterae.AAC.3